MKILFVKEPHLGNAPSGPNVVAQKLLQYLSRRVEVFLYPRITYVNNLSRLVDIVGKVSLSYKALLGSDIDLLHFITVPIITDFTSESLILLSKLKGMPIIINIHGIIYRKPPQDPERRGILREKQALISHIRACRADKIVVNSHYMKNLASSYYEIPKNKIAVIPNGVDTSEFTPMGNKVHLDGDPAILYAGRLSWEKGIDILIRATQLIKEDLRGAKIHIVGSGPWLNNAIMLARKLNVYSYIRFHGSVQHHSLPRIFRGAETFVLPSRVEAFGMVLLEAMGCGLPVVASSVGGIPEIVKQHENGVLVPPENPVELSKAIVEVNSDSALRKRLSTNAVKTALEYSWENIADKYLKLYGRLTIKWRSC